MYIGIGCDHRGFTLKKSLLQVISDEGHQYKDMGCSDTTSIDYPDVAIEVATQVANHTYDRGILICSTGVGMSMAANKVAGIRAALCHNIFTARRSREHNDANVLCLGTDVIGEYLAHEMVREFLLRDFDGSSPAGERHSRRIDKIMSLER